MKTLKFNLGHPEKILKGEKFTTWRISDEKDISVDDIVSLHHNGGEEFARAKVYEVDYTIFANLSKEHEKEGFSSAKEMLKTYSCYYNISVTPMTEVKIIKFNLIDSYGIPD